MSSTTFEPVADDVPRRPRRRWSVRRGEGRDWALMLLISVALAGLSLWALPRGVGYDPQSWLIWGREIGHLDLNTRHASAAVKPFPIFVDVGLALAGSAAPVLWMLVARAGTLLALALAFRLAHRLGGVVAGVAATLGLAMANQFLGYLPLLGMSEPLATAAVLGAADSHLRSHHRAALSFLVVAGLLRPEAWPAVAAYALWWGYAGGPGRRLFAGLVAVVVPAVWFVIDWFGSRQLLRSAEAATHESQGGPLLSREPGPATLAETWHLMSGQVAVLFLLGCAAAFLSWRRSGRPGPLVWLSLGALGWLAVDAVLAQGRFATGAPRYLLPAVGLACVVAGVTVADLARAVRHRLDGTRVRALGVAALGVGLVAVCVPRIAYNVGEIHLSIQRGELARGLQTGLPHAVALAGGRDAILRCGQVSTGGYQRPLLAWQLDVPISRVSPVRPGATGTVIEAGSSTLSRAEMARFRVLANRRTSDTDPPWVVLTTCRSEPRP